MRQNSQTRQTGAAKAIKDIRRATRKQDSAEEKIRIVLDGLRGEETIAEQQSSTVASFLLIMATVLIFTADMHHVMLRAIGDSYTLMEPGASLPMGDMVNIIGRRVADSFALGLRLSAPFVIVGLTYYIGLGLLGRLMPQLQVFFFGLPVQIGLQIWVLSITISGIMLVFLQEFEEAYQGFTLP